MCGCAIPTLRDSNYAYLYERGEVLLKPSYWIYHQSAQVSSLYFKINTRQLLYVRSNKEEDFQASATVSINLFKDFKTKISIKQDSSTFVDIDNSQQAKNLIGKIDIDLFEGNSFFAEVTFTDNNRNNHDTKIFKFVKKPPYSVQQSFLVYEQSTLTPTISPIVETGDSLLLESASLTPDQSIYVDLLNINMDIASPPFDMNFQTQQNFLISETLSPEPENGLYPLVINEKANIYFIKNDPDAEIGLALRKFGKNYPEITSAEDMLGPLRYITRNEEYEALSKSQSLKLDIDNFWIRHSGSNERAKFVIREFYQRVTQANEHFLSYKEGWKTDRGMIYLIYGSPNSIHVGSDSETWLYTHDNNIASLSFTFLKQDNPFTSNDFVLQRNITYRSSWLTGVESWRSGRPYKP